MALCLSYNVTFIHVQPNTLWLPMSQTQHPVRSPGIKNNNNSSPIIRPELIAMRFTAEAGKPYTWILTMCPPACAHTSAPSPTLTSMCHFPCRLQERPLLGRCPTPPPAFHQHFHFTHTQVGFYIPVGTVDWLPFLFLVILYPNPDNLPGNLHTT